MEISARIEAFAVADRTAVQMLLTDDFPSIGERGYLLDERCGRTPL